MSVKPSLTQFELILDLDSTLVHSNTDIDQLKILQIATNPQNTDLRDRIYSFDLVDAVGTPGTGSVSRMWGVFRPYLFDFIDFAHQYFDKVIVWSAGQYKYVHAVTDVVFNTQYPSVVKTYEDCIMSKHSIFKPLSKLCSQDNICDLSKLIAIDDRADTFSQNKDNGILIPPYEPEFTREGIMKSDISLLQLMYWFLLPEVRSASDIRKLDKSSIFTTPIETYLSRLKVK